MRQQHLLGLLAEAAEGVPHVDEPPPQARTCLLLHEAFSPLRPTDSAEFQTRPLLLSPANGCPAAPPATPPESPPH